MNRKHSWKFVAPTVLLGLAMSIPAFAQDDNTSASDSMHQAGEKIEQAGSDTAAAAKHAYHGTKRAVADAAITAKVKRALHNDQTVGASEIHVTTTTGVVTLKGQVSSREAASHAEDVAAHTAGVRRVNNQLMVVSAARSD